MTRFGFTGSTSWTWNGQEPDSKSLPRVPVRGAAGVFLTADRRAFVPAAAGEWQEAGRFINDASGVPLVWQDMVVVPTGSTLQVIGPVASPSRAPTRRWRSAKSPLRPM